MMLGVTFSPNQIADRFGCKVDKVLAFIANGELSAINTALKGAKRPTWRITPEALEAFESARTTHKAEQPTPRRRKPVTIGKRYF
jgi:hypothetical protein